jgi:cytoplasmic iron level regulating protein YaaA (DUF328/UPF0246 family)
VSRAPVLLLPPSEGKAPGGDGPPWEPGTSTFPDLDGARAQVLEALARAGQDVRREPTLPALERFTGVLYKELDTPSLTAVGRRRLHATTLVVNGLMGVSGTRDPLPEHRLKMSAALDPLGRLATWWRPQVTDALRPRLARRVVWDLLPGEHAAAWDPRDVPVARRITIRFVTADDRTVSHWNKLLKGAVVRHVVETGLTDPRGLVDLDHPAGYRFDPRSSDLGDDVAAVVMRAT